MTMKNVHPTNAVLSTRIADELRHIILSGQLSPGKRIRQEELADQFGASRIPVREALRILVTDGLVNIVSNSGAWVSSLTQQECSEQYQIRERLEPLLLRFNLPQLTATDISRAGELVQQMKNTPDIEALIHLDREFHWIMYSRVHTSSLTELIERLWNTTQPYRRVYMNLVRSAKGIEVAHLEHDLLLEAIKQADSEEAESILRGHIRRTRIELDRHPEVFAHQSKG